MNSGVKLSVCTVTYNHKNYITQTLDSLLMQKTNFKFQIIVGDDCSTDGTADILKEYAKKYPDIIKPIFKQENIGSARNSLDVYDNAKTPYVAICDGDDYWIDEYKLQKQVDFLETHPDYAICFHPVKVIYEGFAFEESDDIYPSQKMIEKGTTFDLLLKTNFIQTNSVVYRWAFNKTNLKNIFLNISPGDWFINILHAKQGKIKMLPDIMAVYRRHPKGVWSDTIEDMEKHNLKWGLESVNFYYYVYKNITNSSQEYLQDVFLPNLKEIVDVYCRNKKFKELQTIDERYSKYLNMVLSNQKIQNDELKFKRKYKKYKKLFNIALVVVIIQVFVIIFLSFLNL